MGSPFFLQPFPLPLPYLLQFVRILKRMKISYHQLCFFLFCPDYGHSFPLSVSQTWGDDTTISLQSCGVCTLMFLALISPHIHCFLLSSSYDHLPDDLWGSLSNQTLYFTYWIILKLNRKFSFSIIYIILKLCLLYYIQYHKHIKLTCVKCTSQWFLEGLELELYNRYQDPTSFSKLVLWKINKILFIVEVSIQV